MIIYVAFFSPKMEFLGQYWMDHTKIDERKCLGMRCADAFKEGNVVITVPVAKHGETP